MNTSYLRLPIQAENGETFIMVPTPCLSDLNLCTKLNVPGLSHDHLTMFYGGHLGVRPFIARVTEYGSSTCVSLALVGLGGAVLTARTVVLHSPVRALYEISTLIGDLTKGDFVIDGFRVIGAYCSRTRLWHGSRLPNYSAHIELLGKLS